MPNNSRTNFIVEKQTSLLQILHTHIHGDHTAGNPFFGKMGVVIPARDELREQMIHPPPLANGNRPRAYLPPAGLFRTGVRALQPIHRQLQPGTGPLIPAYAPGRDPVHSSYA